ncbi:hypothetical protein [Oricola thermophila]|uniref:DUF3168 domain-containing protein n=1 Tax=Oricola thermophila TaxID=2742145 RepID=A0A6N1VDC4_9HYPH|nr:hypothetical protein [Oricola thermophila]QKV18718.1 hypothetical protein HTY61_09780 [Oricola thermophila]
MAHPRKAFRKAVVAALKGWPDLAGYDVAEARLASVDRAADRAISVYTPSENSRRDGRGNPLSREVQAVVVGHVRASDPQDAADDLAEIVEAVQRNDESFGGTCRTSHLSSTEVSLDDGEVPGAVVTLTISAFIQSGPAAS